MNLREVLKEKTRHLHQMAETILNLQSCQTRDAYLRMLQNFWNFYANFENELRAEAATAPATKFYLQDRQKSAHLRADLITLQGHAPVITRSHRWGFAQWPPARLWGFLYVVEGSSLGGQMIARELARRFDLTEQRGLQFFSGYGNRTGAMWQAFVKELNAIPADQSAKDEALLGAQQGFGSLLEFFANPPCLEA